MSTRRGRPRTTAATSGGQSQSPKPASIRYRIVIHETSDGDERVLADYTVDGYVAAIGRRLPSREVEHKTLRGGPLDLTIGLAGLIPDAMAEFIDKHLRGR
jgi:hypothetical protein